MTVDEIMLEIENLSDEELNNLCKNIYIFREKQKEIKRKEAIQKLREAWIAVTSLGVDIYDGEDNLINNFEDLAFC